MSYRIIEECVACGACQAECPDEAISEADGVFAIDPGTCGECGTCAEVCPVGACVPG